MPTEQICTVTGEPFIVSDLEQSLRKTFDQPGLPSTTPAIRFRHLGAFWQHWNLHQRQCDKTNQNLISVFRSDCPYPVYQRDTWLNHDDTVGAVPNFHQSVFAQLWEFFPQNPLPHRTGNGNENCEYTDDTWYSKDCYLCHSVYKSQDLRYSYRSIATDSCFSVFSINCELCYDVTNCYQCYEVRYALNAQNCHNSAFLYDCRNCSDCMFCFNLRNAQYCFGNQQLTKQEYEQRKLEWNLASRKVYDKAQKFFRRMMKNIAWHRAQDITKSEDCVGSYIETSKNCSYIFFSQKSQDCVNIARGYNNKDCLDALAPCEGKLSFATVLCMFQSYDTALSALCTECQHIRYCAHCFQCTHCFGCCGLVGKRYHIFNQPYAEKEYHALKKTLIEYMKSTGEWGQFFPGHFAPQPYDESWSGFYWPLSDAEQAAQCFRTAQPMTRQQHDYHDSDTIPDVPQAIDHQRIYWDETAARPFRISSADLTFSQKINVPLPHQYYMRRIQENFAWMPFNGVLRQTTCAKSGVPIQTSWPAEYDGRILSEEEYLKIL